MLDDAGALRKEVIRLRVLADAVTDPTIRNRLNCLALLYAELAFEIEQRERTTDPKP